MAPTKIFLIGPFCNEQPLVCFPDPCFDGECIPNADNTDFECRCDPGFFGLFCETQSCDPNPCQYGNQCSVGLSGVPTCLCKLQRSKRQNLCYYV